MLLELKESVEVGDLASDRLSGDPRDCHWCPPARANSEPRGEVPGRPGVRLGRLLLRLGDHHGRLTVQDDLTGDHALLEALDGR
jgi:hypothetical protein